MAKLIMLRHGQSEWNKLNLFTGWVDIPLSKEGVEESIQAGKKIAHLPIDVIFVSTLVRAQMTAMLAMLYHDSKKVPYILHPGQGKLEEWAHIHGEEAKRSVIPVITAWELNERMYGKLQGLNKKETMDKHGKEQVQIWRRSFDIAPPGGESLAMTAERTLPYFKQKIVPLLNQGKNLFISAHGNSLRAMMMYLDNLSKEEVVSLEIATGEPIIYDFDDGEWERSDG